MVQVVTAGALSPNNRRLVAMMQSLNFGRIEDLPVHAGQPVLDPPPRVVREVKFGGDNGPRPEITKADFELKVQVRELFAQMEAMGNGTIRSLEVRHGLPFRMTIEEVAA
ncbi:MAG: hypothetical protein JXL80_09115 [Planctomycetes bacterium]|nr:hypothetical protein [Planctomycetota bacterium]